MSTTPLPNPAPALDTASRRDLRDLFFAWIYVTLNQLPSIGERSADDIIGDLQSSISIGPETQLYQDVKTWITNIQANPAAFASVAGTFKGATTANSLSSPWDGPRPHPSIDELNLTLANV